MTTLYCNYCGLPIEEDRYIKTVGNCYHAECKGALMPTTPRIAAWKHVDVKTLTDTVF